MNSEFYGKTVAVLGLARSGLACAEVLSELGAHVRLYDSKPAVELEEAILAANSLGLTPYVGGKPIAYEELDCLITSPGVRKDSPQLQNAVAAGVPVLSEIEAAYRIARAPIFAITGTNGKTTTTILVGEMLRAAGVNAYVAGNVAAGEIALPLIKAAHLAAADEAIVAEISSFQLEWISQFRPRFAALLNITPDHGDRQTWDEYVAAKWRIFENQTAEDFAVLHVDLASDLRVPQLHGIIKTFGGADSAAQWSAFCDPPEIRLPGRHNIENFVAAALMASAFGVDNAAICRVAAEFSGVVHRLEYVDTVDQIKYVNNSMCTNTAAFQKSLEALPEPKVVIAGGVFKGDDMRPLADAVLNNNVKKLVLIGRSAPQIATVMQRSGYCEIYQAQSLQDAVLNSHRFASPGETVLLAPACASFDMFHDFEDRGEQFKAAVHILHGHHDA